MSINYEDIEEGVQRIARRGDEEPPEEDLELIEATIPIPELGIISIYGENLLNNPRSGLEDTNVHKSSSRKIKLFISPNNVSSLTNSYPAKSSSSSNQA